MSGSDRADTRISLAINLELSHGRHGASARVELHEGDPGTVAWVLLRGWVDRIALRRLEQVIEDLAARRVGRLVLDCSQLRHIDFALVAALFESLARFEALPGVYTICGLSQHLRDLIRLAGCEPSLHDDPLGLPASPVLEPRREWAS